MASTLAPATTCQTPADSGLKWRLARLERMLRPLLAAASIAALYTTSALADPLHARTGGDYWHHDSGWIFPERIAGFERVGVPQDVAGSRDAVAWYAREASGQRVVISVNVFPADSSRAPILEQGCEDGRPLKLESRADWRVRICASISAGTSPELADFVRGQRWDTLP